MTQPLAFVIHFYQPVIVKNPRSEKWKDSPKNPNAPDFSSKFSRAENVLGKRGNFQFCEIYCINGSLCTSKIEQKINFTELF